MGTAYFGNAEGNAWLNEHITTPPCWLALHISEPGPAGDPSTEVNGLGYERQPITFSLPSAKTTVSTNNQIFSGMPASEITWVSVWTDQFAGQMIVALELDTPQPVIEGYQFLGSAGDIAVSI